jgi:RHS repeat-associated protein
VNAALGISSTGESSTLFTGINANAAAAAGAVAAGTVTPKAYLVFLFFNDSYVFQRAGAIGITASAYNAFEKLTRSFKADKNGYLYIYVASESNVAAADVYFDDFYIIHQKNNTTLQVTQSADYYPFGMTFNTYHADRLKVRYPSSEIAYEPVLRNRYLFQGQELQSDLDLGWYQFKWRMHDPSIGRFGGVDPVADQYHHNSPYAFSENRVIDGVDLEGLEYVHYRVIFGNSGVAKKEIYKDYRGQSSFDYVNASESFGPEGEGVKYSYGFYEKDGTFVETGQAWEVTQGNVTDKIRRHGFYYGPGAVTRFGPSIESGYDYSMTPIDEVDAAAKIHDQEYELENYQGYTEDTRTIQADKRFIRNLQRAVTRYGIKGYKDAYTKRAPSREARGAADNAIVVIDLLSKYKEWKVERLEEMGEDPYDPDVMHKVKLEDWDTLEGQLLRHILNKQK